MLTTKEAASEAVLLMQHLGFSPETISEYSLAGKVLMSVNGCAPVPLDEQTKAEVSDFETKHSATVYHVLAGGSESFMGQKCLLFVGKQDNTDFPIHEIAARRGSAFAYIINYLYPECSESGYVAVQHIPHPTRVS